MKENDTTPASPDLTVDIGGITLANPVMTASGTFGYGLEFESLVRLDRLGGIVVKGLSREPSAGNKPPRIAETACGMLNAIGLENIGVEVFIQKKLPQLKTLGTKIIVNIYGKTVEEYIAVAERVDGVDDIAGIELNISCPNVKAGGVAFGVDTASVAAVVGAVRKKTCKPLMVKLSPNVTDIADIARSAQGAGADSLSLINTITGMAVDVDTRRPVLTNITGGLSGPAIKPVALRMVWQVASAVQIPVVGIGGIVNATDALEFLVVGASAVQIGTATFMNPKASEEILDGITAYMEAHQIDKVSDLVGTLLV